MKARSELACRRATRAAIPCEITASCTCLSAEQDTTKKRKTYAEEHPAAHEEHLCDGIGLVRQTAVLALEVREGDGLLARGSILEAAHEGLIVVERGVGGAYGPRLCEVAQVRELRDVSGYN
jgi:hypothetical protein